MNYTIEPMSEIHRQGVMDVFNYYVDNSYAAFPEHRLPYEFFDKLVGMIKDYPSVVVKDRLMNVTGFAFLRPYYFDSTLKRTAEITYFLMPEMARQGIGTKILDNFIEQARNMGVDNILACISSRNEESLRFHAKNGFAECGRSPELALNSVRISISSGCSAEFNLIESLRGVPILSGRRSNPPS
jgi:L-amino acid N-acyltransferase YncA